MNWNGTNVFLGSQKIEYHANHWNIDLKEKGIYKNLTSLKRPVNVVAERKLNPKLQMEEEEEEEED